MRCDLCGGTKKVYKNKRYKKCLCESCRNEIHNNGGELLEVHELPKFGEVSYDKDGKVICHICGKAYDKVVSHVYYKHGMIAREYKRKFGLDVGKGLCSEETKEILRGHVKTYYDSVVMINLMENGSKTRFEKGSKGRTKDMVSEQTKRKLVNSFKQSCEVDE